jgi:hypothetical protein
MVFVLKPVEGNGAVGNQGHCHILRSRGHETKKKHYIEAYPRQWCHPKGKWTAMELLVTRNTVSFS